MADKEGRPALRIASHYGRLRCIRAVAASKPDPRLKDREARNALAGSILRGREGCSLWLSALPDDGDKQGVTPLMHACMDWRQKVVYALVDRADLDHVGIDGLGATALSLAAFNGHIVCVKMLLSAGADPDVADRAGMTALMKASIGRDASPESLLLLACVPDPRLRDAQGRTASDYATRPNQPATRLVARRPLRRPGRARRAGLRLSPQTFPPGLQK